jgi:hypothetical protein
MLQAFLEEPGAWSGAHLRRVICSGEALPYELQQRFFASCRGRAAQPLRADRGGGGRDVLGVRAREARRAGGAHRRPIANTQIYVLDRGWGRCRRAWRASCYIGGVGWRAATGPPRADGRAVRPRPVLRGAGGAALPDGRPGARMAAGGRDRVPRALGPSGEGARLPHRARGRSRRRWRGRATPGARGGRGGAGRSGRCDKRLVAYVVGRERDGRRRRSGERESFLKERLPEYMVPARTTCA